MGVSRKPYNQWNFHKVIKVIIARKAMGLPLYEKYILHNYVGLHTGARRFFGSWRNAVIASGVDYSTVRMQAKPPVKWDSDKVISEIKKRKELGLPLSTGEVHNSDLYSAAKRYCGSWKKAIEGAGFEYSTIKKVKQPTIWTREKILTDILNCTNNGEPLNVSYMAKHHKKLYEGACYFFGSWEAAVQAAGLDYSKINLNVKHRRWNREAVVEEIKHRKEVGLSINGHQVLKERKGLYLAAMRYFGEKGWQKALKEAGINPQDINPLLKWSKERVIGRIKDLHEEGVPVTFSYLRNNGEAKLVQAGERRFGNWRNAIKAAGLQWKSIGGGTQSNWWTKKRIIYWIRYWESKGEQLSSKAMQLRHSKLYAIAQSRFGYWGAAVYAAGINYQAHCKIWSAKAWLRQLSQEDIERLQKQVRGKSSRR